MEKIVFHDNIPLANNVSWMLKLKSTLNMLSTRIFKVDSIACQRLPFSGEDIMQYEDKNCLTRFFSKVVHHK
jgi:hypothetical protein